MAMARVGCTRAAMIISFFMVRFLPHGAAGLQHPAAPADLALERVALAGHDPLTDHGGVS
jgi:hypothetical protein